MNHIRKNIALMLSAMLMISLAGCGSSEGISEETATQTQLAQDQEAALLWFISLAPVSSIQWV